MCSRISNSNRGSNISEYDVIDGEGGGVCSQISNGGREFENRGKGTFEARARNSSKSQRLHAGGELGIFWIANLLQRKRLNNKKKNIPILREETVQKLAISHPCKERLQDFPYFCRDAGFYCGKNGKRNRYRERQRLRDPTSMVFFTSISRHFIKARRLKVN